MTFRTPGRHDDHIHGLVFDQFQNFTRRFPDRDMADVERAPREMIIAKLLQTLLGGLVLPF